MSTHANTCTCSLPLIARYSSVAALVLVLAGVMPDGESAQCVPSEHYDALHAGEDSDETSDGPCSTALVNSVIVGTAVGCAIGAILNLIFIGSGYLIYAKFKVSKSDGAGVGADGSASDGMSDDMVMMSTKVVKPGKV